MSGGSGFGSAVREVNMRGLVPYAALVVGAGAIVLLLLDVLPTERFDYQLLAAMAIGGLVGAVELLGRYGHAPLRAVLTLPGFFYVLVNIGAAWAAYYMLNAFDVLANAGKAKDLTLILTAGLGSLVFMRSSVFKVKIGDADVGIGPAAVLDTLLMVADRGVDRREAVARAQDVTELVSKVPDPRTVAKMLTTYSLALMQNVDSTTTGNLVSNIDTIMDDADVPDRIKMDIVALRLGVVVGPDVLQAAVEALGKRLYETDATPRPAETVKPAGRGGNPGAAATPNSGGFVPTVSALKAEIDREIAPVAAAGQ